MLKRAADTEAQCIKAVAKGEKPEVLEGDIFVGNYEGATEVAYGETLREGEHATIAVDFMYVDPRFSKGHRYRALAWKNRLELGLLEGRWLIRDIRFSQDQSLLSRLKGYIDDGAQTCGKP